VLEPTVSPLMRRARSSTCPRVDAAFRSRRHPPPGCPACGVISTRVHARRRQRVADIPAAGAVEVIWRKRQSTIEVPPRARPTARLRGALVGAVVASGRAASEVARARGVSWRMVQAALSAAMLVLFHNRQPIHSGLGYRTPLEVANEYQQNPSSAA